MVNTGHGEKFDIDHVSQDQKKELRRGEVERRKLLPCVVAGFNSPLNLALSLYVIIHTLSGFLFEKG